MILYLINISKSLHKMSVETNWHHGFGVLKSQDRVSPINEHDNEREVYIPSFNFKYLYYCGRCRSYRERNVC